MITNMMPRDRHNARKKAQYEKRKAKHPRSEFAPAHPEFPTRDGLNYNCRASTAGKPKWRRMPNGRIEMIEDGNQ